MLVRSSSRTNGEHNEHMSDLGDRIAATLRRDSASDLRYATIFTACASETLLAGIGVLGMPLRMMLTSSWSVSVRLNWPRPRSMPAT